MLLGSNGVPPLATRPHDSIDPLRGLENINISALFDPDSSAALSGLAPAWSLSRQARNRLQHALHGNGPPKQRQQPSAISLDQRQLQELLEARTLRAAGWQLPSTIAGNSLVRVYDTRIPKEWVRALAADVQRVDDPDQVVVVGGDFASDTDVTDVDALAHARPAPWASRPAHIFIPPREHFGEWVARLRAQVDLENPATVFSLAAVVARDKCPLDLDEAAIRRVLPAAAPLFDDERLAVEVALVAERAPLLRIPATERQLPPAEWEQAFLPRNKVLVVLHLRRLVDMQPGTVRPAPAGRWIRGTLPDLEPSDLELLRIEYELPPATRQRHAERELKRALAKLAGAVGVVFSPAHRVQNLQPTHGGAVAILAVPRAEALRWLRGSGCGGLFVRPFWTKDTAPALQRERFNLLYLRGRRADAARVWDAVHDVNGVLGLILADKDVAVRIDSTVGAVAGDVQARIRATLQDPKASVRQPTPGAAWWRLGPLTDADLFRVRDLIAATGLTPLRDEVRLGGAGQFRRTAYFQAAGQPTRMTLDDGGWGRGTCSAKLSPATPPPRRRPAALPTTATWGGPRQQPPSATAGGRSSPTTPDAVHTPPPPVAPRPANASGPARGSRATARAARRPVAAESDVIAPPHAQPPPAAPTALDALVLEMRQMREQLEELRRENMQLRQQLATAVQASPYQHQPYALRHPTPCQPLHRLDPAALLSQDERVSAELAAATTVTPRPMETDPTDADAMLGLADDDRRRGREPGATPEKPALKKPLRSASEGARSNA